MSDLRIVIAEVKPGVIPNIFSAWIITWYLLIPAMAARVTEHAPLEQISLPNTISLICVVA